MGLSRPKLCHVSLREPATTALYPSLTFRTQTADTIRGDGGATLTPSPPPSRAPIAVSCLINWVSSRTFLRWEFSDSCTCASSDCSYNTKSFHKRFTLLLHWLLLPVCSSEAKQGSNAYRRATHTLLTSLLILLVYTHFQLKIHISCFHFCK